MTQPVFGLQFIREDDQAIPVISANLDVIGIIGPCSTADPTTFPLNTPVLFFSNDTVTIAKLGTDGYIPDAINGINSQLADFEVAAQIVVVRTAYGVSGTFSIQQQQTIANIMGDSGSGTGVWAFLAAPNLLYCTPRLIIAPGYTGQMANSLDTLAINVVGHGYIPGQLYQATFAAGGGETNGAQLVLPAAHAVADANGNINEAQLTIDSYGAWFSVAPTATLPAPDGASQPAIAATGQIIFSANPGVGATIGTGGTTTAFVSSGASGAQVNIGANLSATMTSLLAYLNASVDTNISKATYSLNGGTITITDKTAGAAGNSFALTSTVSGVSLSGPNLTGGADAVSPTRATLTVTSALGANPVVSALAGGVLDGLAGHGVVESSGISRISDQNWRNTINSKRIIALSGGVKILDPVSADIIVVPFAPRVVGAIIARDFATGYPFHSAANQPIQGIVAPARTITFSLTDGATEGQVLLGDNLGILVRGEIGVETAISNGGFVFIGTDTCSDDPTWMFYNVTRGRDYIELTLMPAIREYLGKSNIDRNTVNNIIQTIEAFLGKLRSLSQIIGFDVSFQGNLNSAAEIRLGHLTVSFAAEEPSVLRLVTMMSSRDAPAIDALISDLAQTLNSAA